MSGEHTPTQGPGAGPVFDGMLEVKLSDLVDGPSLSEVCKSYHKLFNVPIRFFTEDGALLADSVHKVAACEHMLTSAHGRRECTKQKERLKKYTPQTASPDHFSCVCGLDYTVVPLRYQGMLLGKITFGPYRPDSQQPIPKSGALQALEIDLDELEQKILDMRKISRTVISRIAKALLAVMDVILLSAHKAHVTTQVHVASVRESYRELLAKNKQLEQMQENIKEFEQLKSNFLSTVSHELRTPLTSIIGYSEMLYQGIAGDMGDEQKQFIGTIKTKGEELLGLISSILDFSTIESGRTELHVMEIAPAQIVERAVAECRPSAERRGVRIVVDLDDDLGEVLLDPEKIETALRHLIENGIKFSHPGGVVHVSARRLSPEPDKHADDGFGFVLMSTPETLEIAVRDYGIGIAQADQVRVFSPFVQVDNSSTRERGGAGLGLALVKTFVEKHGGQVEMDSNEGEGSTFAMRIPIVNR